MNAARLSYFLGCLSGYRESTVSQVIAREDGMLNEWYFGVGVSAVHNIVLACLSSRLDRIHSVLDLPCGHGRVLRHLVKLFPDAAVTACDIDRGGVDFCTREFGARRCYSSEDPEELAFEEKFDVIWVGSLFTHLDRSATRRWTRVLCDALSPKGILVATLHGRASVSIHERHPYIDAGRWAQILRGYEDSGYGFASYQPATLKLNLDRPFGVSLSRPSSIMRDIEDVSGVRILMYRERSWADHQDLLVVGKPGPVASA